VLTRPSKNIEPYLARNGEEREF